YFRVWPAAMMTAPLTTKPIALRTVASSMTCRPTDPVSVFTNCGNKAKTNNAILGLSRLVTRPCLNIRANGVGSEIPSASAADPADFHVVQARYSRYPAPAHLTIP